MTDTNKHSGDSDELWFPEDDLLQETDSFFDESPSGKSADGKHSGRNRSASGRSASKGGNKRSPSGRSRGANRNRKHSSSRKKGGKRRSRETYLHLAIAGVLLVMFLVAAIRLIIWNIGEDSGFDPNADTSEFDTEALDYVQQLDPALLEGHEDDGVTNIVCLGNAPFADDRSDNGLAGLIAQACDATVYNCAFPDSYISMKYQEYSDSYPQDALSLYLTVASFCGGDFTLMEHAAPLLPENADIAQEALDTLKSVDFSTVDMIVMMYDLSDYRDQRPVLDENNDINLLTWNGALNASIQMIQQTFPYIRIVVLSPSYGQFEDENGNLINPDTEDFGHGALPDYVQHQIDVAMYNGVSILDNYYGTITENDQETCLTDGYHLNEEGRRRVVSRFAKEIFGIEETDG